MLEPGKLSSEIFDLRLQVAPFFLIPGQLLLGLEDMIRTSLDFFFNSPDELGQVR